MNYLTAGRLGVALAALAFLFAFGARGTDAQPKRTLGPYEVQLEKSVLVHMRDGTRLSTDIYSPVDIEDVAPAILIRLPYNKNQYMRLRQDRSDAYFFSSHGFVVLAQDMRGRYESEGEYVVGRANRDDGYDTVSWIVDQEWSNGKVGTYGCSYLGENQLQLAATRHPNHAAAIPQAAGGGYNGTYRTFLFMDGGAFEMASGLGWFSFAGRKWFERPDSELPDSTYHRQVQEMTTAPSLPGIDLTEAFRDLPVIDILKKRDFPPTDYEDFVSHIPGDPYWKSLNYVNDDDRFNVPALHVNSWYDLGPNETMMLFNLMSRNADSEMAARNQFVIMSPTSHCASEFVRNPVTIGTRSMGDATLEYFNIYLDWFNHWLKGEETGVSDMPRIRYFLMGKNEWRSAPEWPLPDSDFQKWYLSSSGNASRLDGDGVLSRDLADKPGTDTYTYDPGDPVPSVGGPICCVSAQAAQAGSYDQREVEGRDDVLVYTSEVLSEGLEVTGPMTATLYVSSTARDTDFTVKLVDVYPDGTAYNVQETILRARFREGFDREVFMESGNVYELNLDLHATGNYFGEGHRIRLEVSSSNFPRFDRNLNTGGNNYDESAWVTATNTIHYSEEHPSHIVLPVIPN